MAKGLKRREVVNFEPYPEHSYVNVDLTGLATFAIKRLQELGIPVTFENLVIALFKLFPTKFSLEGFDEYPDAARVGRTLLQLGPKYRNWARGSVQKGFVLTEAGATKAAMVGATLLSDATSTLPPSTKRQSVPRTMDLTKEMTLIESSSLFQKWKAGKLNEGESIEFFDLLGAYAYTPARALRDRAHRLVNTARELGRADVSEFLNSVQQQFEEHLRE